jgi:hypothetical protein
MKRNLLTRVWKTQNQALWKYRKNLRLSREQKANLTFSFQTKPLDAALDNLQKENEILSASLEQSRLKIIEMASNGNSDNNHEIIMQQQRNQFEQDRKRLDDQFQVFIRKNEKLETERLDLLKSLEAMSDYNSIKSELSLLKVLLTFSVC